MINEKALKTIIEKYGSYEAFVQQRYHNPEKAEKRAMAASKAGRASQASKNAHRPFNDRQKAQAAQRKSLEARRAKNT